MVRTKTGLRVMLDANILISGCVWPRWPYEVLQHAVRKDFQLVLSPYIIEQAVKQLDLRFPGSIWRLDYLLDMTGYELIKNPAKEQVVQFAGLSRDETDIPVALAAINGKVDYLVSEDKNLTVKDETTAQLRQHLKVLISGTFLRAVMDWSSDELEKVKGRTWRDLQK
jgi:predicted nucleic acid-binding protein